MFGRLKAIDLVKILPRKGSLWKCECSCGKEHIVSLASLRSGNTRSCGCLGRDVSRAARGPANANYKDGRFTKDSLAAKKATKKKNCQMCGSDKRLCWDHDHKTGLYRGTLCSRCNSLLGFANDDVMLLEKGINYLKGLV